MCKFWCMYYSESRCSKEDSDGLVKQHSADVSVEDFVSASFNTHAVSLVADYSDSDSPECVSEGSLGQQRPSPTSNKKTKLELPLFVRGNITDPSFMKTLVHMLFCVLLMIILVYVCFGCRRQ